MVILQGLLRNATDRKAVELTMGGILRVRIARIVTHVVPNSRSHSSTRPIVAKRAAIVERTPTVVAGAEELERDSFHLGSVVPTGIIMEP